MKHLRVKHPKAGRFPCDECGRSFARKSQVANHRKVHTTAQPYQCDECGRRYKYKSHLFLHRKRSNHSIGDANRIGDDLSEVENSLDFKLSALFSMILTGETEGKFNKKKSNCRASNGVLNHRPSFRCDECGKEFTLRRALTKHRRLVHTSGKPIECGHCGKLFKHQNSLLQHCRLFSIECPVGRNS